MTWLWVTCSAAAGFGVFLPLDCMANACRRLQDIVDVLRDIRDELRKR